MSVMAESEKPISCNKDVFPSDEFFNSIIEDKMLRNACIIAAPSAINARATFALRYSIKRDRPFITYGDIADKAGSDGPFQVLFSL